MFGISWRIQNKTVKKKNNVKRQKSKARTVVSFFNAIAVCCVTCVRQVFRLYSRYWIGCRPSQCYVIHKMEVNKIWRTLIAATCKIVLNISLMTSVTYASTVSKGKSKKNSRIGVGSSQFPWPNSRGFLVRKDWSGPEVGYGLRIMAPY